jgi:23S rRNA pseudoU1915 N3-methylase RlmH
MNLLKFVIFCVGILSIDAFFFRKDKKKSLEYGKSFAQARAITYKELHEKQLKEKEAIEKIKKEREKEIEEKKKDEINRNMINIMFDL